MGFTFENQGTHTYLVYTVAAEDAVDSMSLGMLTNNKIAGLAHTLYTQMDENKFIKYDVSAKISVKQFFTGQVNKKRLTGVFNGIVDAMLSAEEYMIDVNTIMLDLDYIFVDVSTCETVLVCLPIVSDEFTRTDLGAFFKNIMFSTQFDQTENCDHVAKMINYLNSSPVFSLEEFKKLLDTISGMTTPSTNHTQQPVTQPKVQEQQTHAQFAPQNNAQYAQSVQSPVHTPPQTVTSVKSPVTTNHPIQTPPAQARATQPARPEKKISMLGLMMHYSKENAALYKAQKEAKKNGQGKIPAAAPTSNPAMRQPQSQGFVVPGQSAPPVNQGFAVPGQSAPPVNQGFAVPGQQPYVQSSSQKAQCTSVPPTPQPQAMVSAATPTYSAPKSPQLQAMNFGETTVLGGGMIDETTVLGAAPSVQVKPHLIRLKNNEKINLDKPVYRIGKEKSYVDYFIGDNSAISRSHANFITREGEYFVVDTNSTNHTYVNGTMIQSNVETSISHGVKIKLANEEFEFKLY